MKVLSKQRNSRMCIICGMDNEYGIHAPFYNMEDGSVMTKFRFRPGHQSYPERVHGGMITAMIDEMGLRALWAKHDGCEDQFGVTMSLNTNYRKPVPYDTDLIGKGIIVRESSKFFIVDASIMDVHGNLLANGTTNYIKLDVSKIAHASSVHEEMAYFIEDGITDISFEE